MALGGCEEEKQGARDAATTTGITLPERGEGVIPMLPVRPFKKLMHAQQQYTPNPPLLKMDAVK